MTTPPPTRRRRRFLQFSLRALLVFVLLVSIGMSWFAVKLQRARRQKEAVEAIQKAGGWVKYDYEAAFPFAEPSVPKWARKLFGDDFFFDVVEVWEAVNVGDDEARHLKVLTSLVSLDLSGGQITDAGLEDLEELTNLETLYLTYTPITDAGLENLKGLTDLEWLGLTATRITDAGLGHLEGLTNLIRLEGNCTQVTDAGLEHLKGLRSLRKLNLRGTKVTPEGVDKLREALPECKIKY